MICFYMIYLLMCYLYIIFCGLFIDNIIKVTFR